MTRSIRRAPHPGPHSGQRPGPQPAPGPPPEAQPALASDPSRTAGPAQLVNGAAGGHVPAPAAAYGQGVLAPAPRGTPADRAGRTTAEARPRPRRRRSRWWTAGALVAGDCVAVLVGAAVAGAGALRCGVLALGVLLLACRQADLYRPGFDPRALLDVPAIVARAALAWGFAAAVLGPGLGRAALLGAVAATAATACGLRALTYRVRRVGARRRPGSTLVIGAEPAAGQIAAALQTHPEYGMRPVGVVTPGAAAAGPAVRPPGALPVLTGPGEITRAVIQNAVRCAVVAGPPAPDARTAATVRLLAAHGCRVWQVSTGLGRAPSGHLWGFAARPLELAPYGVPGPVGRCAKRALDAVVSGTALLCLSPVLAACALAVRLADGPDVIFRQERIGLGGRPFTILKFRTLRPSGGERESATRWSIAHDGRMTRVGRLLRRTSLDELPQLWNVLRGDMSLVGPRPERPHFVEQFGAAHPGYHDRHRMPAGITGLAQVHGLRGDTSIADRARFDNHYIDSWSLWQDMELLLRTALSVFRFVGS